jgi:hypothetical protein
MKVSKFRKATLLLAFHTLIFNVTSCDGQRSSNTSLSNAASPELRNAETDAEDFDTFLKSFFSKKDLQFERIVFPLQNLLYDIDSEGCDTTQINRKDWSYTNMYKRKDAVLEVTKRSNTQCILNVQIKETGVSVDYIFTLKDQKWFLERIVDQST